MEWTPDYIQWSINGNVCRREDGSAAVKYQNKPQVIMMNFWTPTFNGWKDNFSEEGLPWFAKYDWVRVEKYNPQTRGFDWHWQDDFNNFDFNRWVKSENWSFGQNSSTFFGS